jgi:isopentenyl phosphate kinase
VIHGDAIIQAPRSLILSGDTIVYHNSLSLKPRFVLFLSNVQGVYDRPPEGEEAAELISSVAVDKDGSFKLLSGGGGGGGQMQKQMQMEFTTADHDTTGGMEAKVRDAVQIARRGIDVLVAKAGSDAALRALEGFPSCLEDAQWCGTHFHPC